MNFSANSASAGFSEARLAALWSSHFSEALDAARALYAPEPGEAATTPEIADSLATDFRRLLRERHPRRPDTRDAREEAAAEIVTTLLQRCRHLPDSPHLDLWLTTALRPVLRVRPGALTPEVCALLYDFHRELWTRLTRPQQWALRRALAKTLSALPPDALTAFWDNFRSPDPILRQAMLVGLDFLRAEHAVPQLLFGLEYCRDHASRAAIVDCLEQVADPLALAPLARLRRESAHADWTLSRHIARVMGIIELHNPAQNQRTLLRPAAPHRDPASLLRPASDADARERADAEGLLRPASVAEASRDRPPGS